ncbi:MAG: NAD-dependent epimerase/dehydratase family protein [bacterium]|nr:NAD-dependent epimerase/dehydratase family protein [bacterium]
MLKVAITGSRGFVGSAIVRKIRDLEVELIEIDFELGYDMTDWNSLSNIVHFDVLIHLAAKTYVPDSFKNPASFYKTNVIGTLNALELCRKYRAKMIYTSSYVYGSPNYLPIDETHPVSAFNPYAQSKLLGEELCRAYYRDFGVPSIIFRPFNIYGKGQNENFLIPSIIKQAHTGIIELNDPRPKRDFIYIDDVADAYLKAIFTNLNTFEIFNLGSGASTSIQDLVDIVLKKIKNNITLKYTGVQRKNEVLETRADVSKSNKLLKWKPIFDIDKGVNNIICDEV